MKRFGTILLSIGLVAAVAMAAGLAQAKSLDEILKAGEIRVGINPTLPPLGVFNEKNEIDGFDKDVAQASLEFLTREAEVEALAITEDARPSRFTGNRYCCRTSSIPLMTVFPVVAERSNVSSFSTLIAANSLVIPRITPPDFSAMSKPRSTVWP